MTETIKTNFALRPETVRNIEKLAEQTHRGKSNVVDWLVAEAMEREGSDQTLPREALLRKINEN